MIIRKFGTIIENGKVFVMYSRDGEIQTKQETSNPLGYIIAMLQNLQSDPHIIHNIIVEIIQSEVPKNN